MSRQKPSEAGTKGRWSCRRKVSVVLELLRGADLDSVSRRHGVTAATLSSWRDEFLASGEAGLKSRETHVDEEETQRLKRVVARILRVWELPRSTFYAQRARRAQPATGRRGRTPTLDDAALLAQIRTVIAESPFHGEGHRKIWARLRTLKQVRTSMRRVLRVMREAALLAPARPPEPVVERPHDGTIVPERPNVMWGTDATAAVTIVEGPATIVAAIDPCTAECVGIHATRHGDRFDALEPLRQGVRAHFGGLAPAIAHGLALRHDHGSVYLSGDFQTEITFLGMTSSPAFVRQPEGDGCIERCFRTLNEQLLWVRHFNTIEELRQALLAFKETYNREWLIARLGYRSPTQTRQAFAVRPAA